MNVTAGKFENLPSAPIDSLLQKSRRHSSFQHRHDVVPREDRLEARFVAAHRRQKVGGDDSLRLQCHPQPIQQPFEPSIEALLIELQPPRDVGDRQVLEKMEPEELLVLRGRRSQNRAKRGRGPLDAALCVGGDQALVSRRR